MTSSLLRVEAIAASPDFPKELRDGVPKPEIPEDERNALHNVTSALYNKDPVRQATNRAIAAVCRALNVPVPDKSKRARKNKGSEKEEQPPHRILSPPVPIHLATAGEEAVQDEESEFEGFELDVDEPGPAVGEPGSEAEVTGNTELSKYSRLLGNSSEDEDDELDEERLERFKGKETVNLDDISLSGSAPEADSVHDSDSQSESASPPPAKERKRDVKKSVTAARIGVTTDSTFLPSLMGGYMSGSESASDIEEARPQKRRGQRARQAIWEKKYGASAKHLQSENQKAGRDAGWDMRRGAVEGDGRDRKTPWKKGASNPLARTSNRGGVATRNEAFGKSPKRDDEGSLHPSWAAKKQAQNARKEASFSGQKIVFE